MNRFLAICAATAALVFVSGCQDGDLRADLARTQQQVAQLQDENERLSEDLNRALARPDAQPTDLSDVMRRLSDAERRLREAESRLKERKPVEAKAEVEEPAESDPAEGDEYARFKAMQDRYNEEQEVLRRARRAERQVERTEQMQEFARRAKEAGLDFDPSKPRESGMQIWMDPAKRDKAMKIAVDMFQEQRLAPLGLDERQRQDVLRIEADTRKRVREVTEAGRQTGATPEEIAKQVDTVRKETEGELQRTMNEEQYEEYKKTAAEGAMMPGTIEELGGMLPPGMIPGFGGGQGG